MPGGIFAYTPIGIIHSGHTVPENTPVQPVFAHGCRGSAELFPEFADGLQDIEGFSHIYLIFHFHLGGAARLRVKPFLQDIERGVFATRYPARPNPIGISIVRLLGREGNTLMLDGLDVLDGAPLLDIKPYVSRFDCIQTTGNGWQDEVDDATARSLGTREFRRKDKP